MFESTSPPWDVAELLDTPDQAAARLAEQPPGPGAVLAEIKARFDSVPGLYLKSVEQKDAELVIKGESPNEASITRFGQSMEFSSGLFTNLNIETQREAPQAVNKSNSGAAAAPAAQPDANAPQSEVVTFTIKCNYANSGVQQAAGPATTVPANHVARN